jgi:hypothetical protein
MPAGPTWMHNLLGTNPNITKMAIPGTHDSATGAYTGSTPMVKCQHQTIAQQLNLGVRALDIRVGFDSNTQVVQTYHGGGIMTFVQVPFQSVLQDINAFLNLNGDEFVILMLKNESTWYGPEASNQVNALIVQVLGGKVFPRAAAWPDLGQVGGRVLVFSRMASPAINDFRTTGWADNVTNQVIQAGTTAQCKVRIQDLWKGPDKDDKQDAVRVSVREAQRAVNNDELFLNFTSYSLTAQTPDDFGRQFNTWLRLNIGTGTGVICVDAVDQTIADHIVDWNGVPYAPTAISSATIAGHRCDGLVNVLPQCTKVCQRRGSIVSNPYWHYCTGCHKVFCDTCAARLVSWKGITLDKRCDRNVCLNRTERV